MREGTGGRVRCMVVELRERGSDRSGKVAPRERGGHVGVECVARL